ncbi:MAG: ABC transporter substrate-binding protein [Gammaproteobacteria bacterium]|nr:ABC transporter substrate-binding protein [Gammaproteobacteria bacterium]
MKYLLPLVLFLSVSGAAMAGTTAEATVENLHAHLLEAMQGGDSLGYSGRHDLLAPVIEGSFDFETIASIVTGRAWKTASAEQRAAFLDTFDALSVATYATNFSGYDGERFETRDSEDSRGSRIVRTVLVKSDGNEITLNYMLRETNGDWRIINVVAQGVSDLSLKRAEYTAVIESEGFDSLVRRLREKVSEMAH